MGRFGFLLAAHFLSLNETKEPQMLGRFNPAVLMAAIMGNLAEVSRSTGGGRTVVSNFRGLGLGARYPTRKMIEKRRNKVKAKMGRTR
jgi:hypothetical protein